MIRETSFVLQKKKKKKNVFFLINCWSSVVASVVSPQLCNLHCQFLKGKRGEVLPKIKAHSSVSRIPFFKKNEKKRHEKRREGWLF